MLDHAPAALDVGARETDDNSSKACEGQQAFQCKRGVIRFGHQPVSDAEMSEVRLLQFLCPDCADSPFAPLPSRCAP